MIQHTCGAVLPATVGDFVQHLAACTKTRPAMRAWTREIVATVAAIAAMDETPVSPPVSPAVPRGVTKTCAESAELSPSDMAVLRDKGKTLRDIAAVSGVAPETVRRRLARLAEGSES